MTNSIKAKAVGLSQRIQRQLSITSPKLGECSVNRSQNLQHFPWPLTSGFTSDLRDLVPSSPASHKAVPHRESSKRIVKAKSVNDGKQVDMEFADGTAFRFHTGWMKDSHPNLVGEDTYRKSAQTILENDQYTAEMLNLSSDGSLISVHFKNHSNQKGVTEEYPSDWLHAFAPYVGSPLNNSSYMNKGSGLPDTGSLLEDIYKNRKPWDSTLEIPKFSGPELLKDENLQIQFLETMMETGVAMISDIGKPQSLQDVDCGKPLEDFVFSIIGRINQHPVRATRFGVIHSEAAVAENSSDYDCKNPLSMHTDHSHYHGTPGYLQFMYQARGSVTSKVCDGLAVAEYLREHHPKDFEMLSKVNVTHSIRNSTWLLHLYGEHPVYLYESGFCRAVGSNRFHQSSEEGIQISAHVVSDVLRCFWAMMLLYVIFVFLCTEAFMPRMADTIESPTREATPLSWHILIPFCALMRMATCPRWFNPRQNVVSLLFHLRSMSHT